MVRKKKEDDGGKKPSKAKRTIKPRGVQLELPFPTQPQGQEQPQQTEPVQPAPATAEAVVPKLSHEDRVATASMVADQYHTRLERRSRRGGDGWYDTHDAIGFGDAISLMLTLMEVSGSVVSMSSKGHGWVVSILLA